MFSLSQVFHARLDRGEKPIPYIVIQTHLGYRAYAEKELGEVFDVLGLIADGSTVADGSETAGSESAGVIEKAGRVINFGSFERTLAPSKSALLTAYVSKQKQHLTVTLANADRHFSRILPVEPFLGRPLSVYIGYEDMSQSEHMRPFDGTIMELSIGADGSLTLEADER